VAGVGGVAEVFAVTTKSKGLFVALEGFIVGIEKGVSLVEKWGMCKR